VGLIGAGILMFMVLFSFVGPLIYHTNQVANEFTAVALAPSAKHLLGTDESGYDVVGGSCWEADPRSKLDLRRAHCEHARTRVGRHRWFSGGWVDTIMMRSSTRSLRFAATIILVAASIFVPTSRSLLRSSPWSPG